MRYCHFTGGGRIRFRISRSTSCSHSLPILTLNKTGSCFWEFNAVHPWSKGPPCWTAHAITACHPTLFPAGQPCCAPHRDEHIYVFQIHFHSTNFISKSNPNPINTDRFKIQILFKSKLLSIVFSAEGKITLAVFVSCGKIDTTKPTPWKQT